MMPWQLQFRVVLVVVPPVSCADAPNSDAPNSDALGTTIMVHRL